MSPLMKQRNVLLTRHLSLGYEGEPVITHLDLGIPAERITALVGPNGCGKSTLLRGLGRLLTPTAGTVYLDGAAIAQLSTGAIAKLLGILPQSPVAPEGLTVRDLVAMGRYPYQRWWQQWSNQDERMTQGALLMTRLQELAERTVDTLSGGQRQRAWIAMILAQDTQILLLDEPTTFLDLAHQVEVLELLWELNRNQGRTVVMVLHDLNQACRYADHVVMLREGVVFAQGEPTEVMTEEIVQQVFDLECRIVADPVAGTPMCIPLSFHARRRRDSLA